MALGYLNFDSSGRILGRALSFGLILLVSIIPLIHAQASYSNVTLRADVDVVTNMGG